MKKGLWLKIGRISATVLTCLFLAIALFSVLISILSKRDEDGAVTIAGYQMRFVISDSMEKCEETDVSNFDIKSIPLKSLLFIETVPEDKNEALAWYGELREGDVLTFKYVYTKQETITHRITHIEKYDDGYVITLEGDNKTSDSTVLKQVIDTRIDDSPNFIIGKVVSQNYPLGLIVSALKSPICIFLIIIIPCLIIIALEVIRIFGVLDADRKKESERKENEIKELKKRLAMHENLQDPTETENEAITPNKNSEQITKEREEDTEWK